MAKTLLPWYENLAVGAGLQGGWSLQLPFLVRTSDLTLRHGGGSVSFEPVATQTVSFVVLSSRSSDISVNIFRIPRRLARTKSNKIKLVYFGSSFCVTQYDFFSTNGSKQKLIHCSSTWWQLTTPRLPSSPFATPMTSLRGQTGGLSCSRT